MQVKHTNTHVIKQTKAKSSGATQFQYLKSRMYSKKGSYLTIRRGTRSLSLNGREINQLKGILESV